MELPLTTVEIVLLTLLAVAITFIPFIRHIPTLITTLIHEVGHGVVSIPFGGGIPHIRIEWGGSGEETHGFGLVPPLLYPLARVLHLFAGSSAPIYIGGALLFGALTNNTLLGGILLFGVAAVGLLSMRNLGAIAVCLGFFLLVLFGFASNGGHPLFLMFVVGGCVLLRGIADVISDAQVVFSSNYFDIVTDFHHASEDDDLISLSPPVWFCIFAVVNLCIISWLVSLFFS